MGVHTLLSSASRRDRLDVAWWSSASKVRELAGFGSSLRSSSFPVLSWLGAACSESPWRRLALLRELCKIPRLLWNTGHLKQLLLTSFASTRRILPCEFAGDRSCPWCCLESSWSGRRRFEFSPDWLTRCRCKTTCPGTFSTAQCRRWRTWHLIRRSLIVVICPAGVVILRFLGNRLTRT